MPLSPARLAFLQASRYLLGLTAPDPAYAALVAPFEVAAGDDARVAAMMQMSGCALVFLGLARIVLSLPPPVPYITGHAFPDVYALAGGSPWAPGGACRLATLEAPPQPGDGIVWGPNGSAVAHVDACVVSVEDPDNGTTPAYRKIMVIAGGQRDEHGNETVKEIERLVRWDGRHWIDRANGRPIIAVLDAGAMAERHGLLDTGAASL